MHTIPGYTYGQPDIADSPVTLSDLRQLLETMRWSHEDAAWIRKAGNYLAPQAEAMVDYWRSIIAKQPHLLQSFLKADGTPDEAYKAAVKARFVQWVCDTCQRDYDADWLAYQHQIALRHTPAKKNQTDGGHTPDVVPLRYLLAFADVIAQSGRQFLRDGGADGRELEAMQAAWRKSVMLQVTFWSRAYTQPELW